MPEVEATNSPSAPKDGPARGSTEAWFFRNRQRFPVFGLAGLELLVVFLLVLVVFYTRLLGLESVEVGGDAITVWEFCRDLLHGTGLPDKFNHHTARFGLVIPTLVIQWIWGSSPTSYFIGPVVASVTTHLLAYLIGRKISGALAGLWATLTLLFFAPMVRASSQILPEAYGPMYTLMAILAALQFTDSRKKWSQRSWMALAAVAVVGAYGSKESYLYFVPCVAIILWRSTRTPSKNPSVSPRGADESQMRFFARLLWNALRDRGLLTPCLLGLALVAVVLMEWIFFAAVTEKQMGGRLSVILGSHSAQGAIDSYQVRSVGDFFALYTMAPREWLVPLVMGAFSVLGVAAFGRDPRARQLALGFFIYFLLQTFVLRSFSPPIPWMEPHPRYLIALAAPLALMSGIFLNDAVCRLGRVQFEVHGALRNWGRAGSLCIAVILLAKLGAGVSEQWDKDWGKGDTWHQTVQLGKDLSAAFEAGIPIVSETPKGKPARAALSVYIDPGLLYVDGAYLPAKFLRKLDQGSYVARSLGNSAHSKKHLDNAVRRRTDQGKCAILLQQRVRGMRGRAKYADGCLSLHQELEEDPTARRPYKRKSSKKARSKSKGAYFSRP